MIYIAGPVAALAAVAWLVNWIRLDLPRPVLFAAVLALISAVAGGFDELVGATMALASLLAIYMVGDLFDGRARERVRGALAAITVGSVAGTVANVFGPGSAEPSDCPGIACERVGRRPHRL